MIPVTRTKILLPRRPSSLLSRPRLLELVQDYLDTRLFLITAPAGYGKTSLLIDLAYQIEMPVCWYALDVLDKDTQRFAAHLIASISQVFPSFGQQSLATLGHVSSTDADLDRLVTIIVNEAYDHIKEHYCIILDDYHLVNSSDRVNRFVSQFIQNVDENCHLILSSRTLLSLPDLPLLVAHAQVGGLDFEALAFRTHEIQALAQQNHDLTMSETEAKALVAETEGWITGMLLSTRTVLSGLADRVRVARASGVGLYDYLAQQVLDQQPAKVRRFLLESSLLEEFDATRCQQVLGPEQDWQEMIDTVLRNGLFVLPVDNGETWLRYHHLFRDFLQARMAQEHPDEMKLILTQMASIYANQGEWEEAHKVHLRLGESNATADMIERAGPPMMKSGRLTLLAEWIDQLPLGLVDSHPGLLSVRGDVDVMLGDVVKGLSYLDQAAAILRRGTTDEDLPRLARTLLRRAVAHRFLGQYQASLQDAQEAGTLAEQGSEMQAIQAGAWRAQGIVLYNLGQLEGAIDLLGRSLESHTALGNTQSAALLLNDLGLAHMTGGRIAMATDYYQRALDYWHEDGNLFRQATTLNNLGVLHHLKGDYDRALSFLDQAHRTAQQSGYARMGAIALAGIGDLFADLSAPDSAREAYSQARKMALRLNDQNQLRYIALAEAALARDEGDLEKAEEYLIAALEMINEGGSDYERGLLQLESGQLALATDSYLDAKEELAAAIACFEQGGQQTEAAQARLALADACYRFGEQEAYRKHLTQALQLTAKLETEHPLVLPARDARNMLQHTQDDPIVGPRVTELLYRVKEFESQVPALRRRLGQRKAAIPGSSPSLAIRALGAAQVRLNGEPIDAPEWQSRRSVREFFFAVLAHPQGLGKEAIGAVLWPNASDASVKLRFKNAIYRLRRALGQEVVLFDGNLYRFNTELDYHFDVELLETRIEEARSTADLPSQVVFLQEAVDLYQGPYLPEAEGTWVIQRREELRRIFHEAAVDLAKAYLQLGEISLALEACSRILSDDACHERAHRTAMRAHAMNGDRAAVVRQFEECRRCMSEFLSASPSPQTLSLLRSLTGEH